MKTTRSTIYDIAKQAGVSKSTVSRVLNNQTNISEDARRRVLQAIKELQYEPSKIARGLTGTGFDAILAISHRSTNTTNGNPFFSDIIQAISTISERNNFDLILQTAKNPEDELEKCKKKIQGKLVKGIIILSSLMDESFLSELDTYDIPIVVIGKIDNEYNNIISVDTDNFLDSYKLTETLIENGHKKIACLHAPLDVHVSIDRLSGFKQCLFDYNLDLRNDWIVDGGYILDESLIAAKDLLIQEDPPTAVFATDALKSFSIYKIAEEKKLSIPRDISIVGFNDYTMSSFYSPKLSGINIPTYSLGKTATTILFDLIKHQPINNKKISISTDIVITNSVLDVHHFF